MQLNLNQAEVRSHFYQLIPAGLVVKARFNLRFKEGRETTFLKHSLDGSLYLDGVFTILNGTYKGHLIPQLICIEETAQRRLQQDVDEDMGLSLIRAMIESARSIHPDDVSEQAINARCLASLEELDHLECAVKIGVNQSTNHGMLPGRNYISLIVTPEHKIYEKVMREDCEFFFYPSGQEVFNASDHISFIKNKS
jgi:hypothetical protein